MKLDPVVSVLCATYNQSCYIRQTIESVLTQRTSIAFELIVNEDASTDGTKNTVRELERQDDRIKVIYHTENQFSKGRFPREFLLPAASGRYLAWCEGDDVWTDPLKLEKQVEFLQANEQLAGCYTDYGLIDLNGAAIRSRKEPRIRPQFSHLDVLRSGCPKPLTLMLRRDSVEELIGEIGQFSAVKNGDQLICAYATQKGDIDYLPEVTGAYRVGSGFWSTMENSTQSRTVIESFLGMVGTFDSPEEKRAISERLTRRLAMVVVSGNLKDRRWVRDIKHRMADLDLIFDLKQYHLEKWKFCKQNLKRRVGAFLRSR